MPPEDFGQGFRADPFRVARRLDYSGAGDTRAPNSRRTRAPAPPPAVRFRRWEGVAAIGQSGTINGIGAAAGGAYPAAAPNNNWALAYVRFETVASRIDVQLTEGNGAAFEAALLARVWARLLVQGREVNRTRLDTAQLTGGGSNIAYAVEEESFDSGDTVVLELWDGAPPA